MIGAPPRIGSVPYLNARPLLEGLNLSIAELVPSALFKEFNKGEFDAAILSSIDVISDANAEAVDGVAIGSKGDVYSVILAYTGELESLVKIQLDPASHTSNALLQIILGEFYGLNPEYVQVPEAYRIDLPALLIGDRAISFRNRTSHTDVRYLDLGGEWYRQTGLPFVFALWALRKDFTEKKFLSDLLRDARTLGLARRVEIANRTLDPAFSLRYFSEWIRYDLGDEEKRGLRLYQDLLRQKKIICDEERKINFF